MKSTPENKIKKQLIALLDAYGVFHWPAAASPYGVGGVPDRLAVVQGRCFGLEVKRPGGKPTALQAAFGKRLYEAGGIWMLIDGSEKLYELEVLLTGLGLRRKEEPKTERMWGTTWRRVESINRDDSISDGFGGFWSAWCRECGKKSMHVVRPGKVQCSFCG